MSGCKQEAILKAILEFRGMRMVVLSRKDGLGRKRMKRKAAPQDRHWSKRGDTKYRRIVSLILSVTALA